MSLLFILFLTYRLFLKQWKANVTRIMRFVYRLNELFVVLLTFVLFITLFAKFEFLRDEQVLCGRYSDEEFFQIRCKG